jgi:hypothetical protein
MKSLVTFFLIVIVFTLVSCNQEAKSVPEKHSKKEKIIDTIVPKKVVSHESETIKKVDLTSKLEEKVKRLAQLEYNYVLKSLDTVPPQKTMFLGYLEYISKLVDSTSKAIDFKFIKNNIHEIRKAFLKGTKPMRPNGNTYPRVTIEEYIFKSHESAKTAFETLMKSKKNSRLWKYFKSPHELFLEENKIYFVNSGGYYMMEIYKDITGKIKN